MADLRVFWMPQIPIDPFIVPVESVREGVFIMDTLAKYDMFQFESNVKPDYCNMGGLEMLENGEWTDWYDDETNEDNPKEWLERSAAPKPAQSSLSRSSPPPEGQKDG